jgi:hypothetical protein
MSDTYIWCHFHNIASWVFLPQPLFAFRRSCNPSMGERILTKVRVNYTPPPLNSLVLQCSQYEMFAYCNSLLLQLRGKQRTGNGSVYSTIHGISPVCIQGDSKRNVNIFGGVTVGQCQKKEVHMNMCVYSWLVSETELSESTHSQSLLIVNKEITVSFILISCLYDKFVIVYNKFSKIPPSNSMHVATRVRRWRAACVALLKHHSTIYRQRTQRLRR